MEQSKNDQEWMIAKEYLESILHLNNAEMLNQLSDSDISEPSVRKKVIKLIDAMDQHRTLFDQTSAKIINQGIQKLMDWSGKNLDGYQVEELIAVGGMSSIYRASRITKNIQKPVAIKIIEPYRVNESIVSLFKQEQQALSKLDHPNIVSFHHGDQTKDGVYYLVMEYIPQAKNLDTYIRQNKCDARAICGLIKQAADAMTYAHSHLVIHKDLKSSNILVDQHGVVKVIDFGIAALMDAPDSASPKVYTPTIASPEQIKGEKVTSSTDIFSLSATLLGVLIEDDPLPAFNPRTYQEINDEKYVDNVLKESNIDLDLKRIIAKGLQTKVNERYKTMDALSEDLGAWLAYKPISMLNHKLGYRIVMAFKRNPLSSIALSLLAVAVLLGAFLVSHYALDARKQAQNSNVSLQFLSDVLSQSDPSKGNASDMTIRQALQMTLDQQKFILANNPEMKLNILTHVAQIYEAQHLSLEAANTSKQLYELLKTHEGILAPATLNRLKILANQLQASGNYADAIESSQLLLSQLELENTDQANLKFAAIYITMKSNLGRMDHKNVSINVKQLIQMIEQGNVNDYKWMGEAYLTMALWESYKKDKKVSELYYQNSLFYLENSVGKINPIYVDALKEYAKNLTMQGKYEEAEQLFIESIKLGRNYDPKGLSLGGNLHEYSILLFKTGRQEEAFELLQQALLIFKESGGEFTLIDIYQTVFKYHKNMLQFSQSLDGLIPAIKASRRRYDDHEIPVARNLLLLSEVLLVANEYSLAEETLKSMLEQEGEIYSVFQDDLEFKLAIIDWKKNKNRDYQNSNNLKYLINILEKHKLKDIQNVKVNKGMGPEYQQLKTILEQMLNNQSIETCQDIGAISSTTDLLVLMIMADLCEGHNTPQLNTFREAVGAASNKLSQEQLILLKETIGYKSPKDL